jgi:serine O-acetyltransferase
MRTELQADVARYRSKGARWIEIWGNPAFWSIFWYRFGTLVYCGNLPRILRAPLKVVHFAGNILCEAVLQMRLPPNAQIGGGLVITHVGGVILHHRTVIGKNCDLSHQVTIGTAGLGRTGVPRLGSDVVIGAGAVIIGGIEIGDGARIAANSLVNRDVPPGATVMGVPAKIVKYAEASEKLAEEVGNAEPLRT